MRILRVVTAPHAGMLRVGIVSVTRRLRIRPAILAEERQEPQPEHVERGHAGGDDADQPKHVMAAAPGRPQNRGPSRRSRRMAACPAIAKVAMVMHQKV